MTGTTTSAAFVYGVVVKVANTAKLPTYLHAYFLMSRVDQPRAHAHAHTHTHTHTHTRARTSS